MCQRQPFFLFFFLILEVAGLFGRWSSLPQLLGIEAILIYNNQLLSRVDTTNMTTLNIIWLIRMETGLICGRRESFFFFFFFFEKKEKLRKIRPY